MRKHLLLLLMEIKVILVVTMVIMTMSTSLLSNNAKIITLLWM
jgi:hypothetical protein